MALDSDGIDIVRRLEAARAGIAAIATRDEAHARRAMTARYKRHDLRPVSGAGRFDFFHAAMAVPEGSFNVLRYGAGVRIDPGDFENFYMVEMPLTGRTEIAIGSGRYGSGAGRGIVISPGRRIRSHWLPGTTQIMLKIDKAALMARWRMATGGGEDDESWPLFHPELDLASASGWRVRQLMGLLLAEFERSVDGQRSQGDATTLSGAVIDALIGDFLTCGTGRIAREEACILPAHIKRCRAHIGAHLDGEITVGRLAAIAGVSERAVYEGFRRFLGKTPMHYVLDARLQRARHLLKAGQAPVATVARACGFGHMGRFSRYYRERYGEAPSTTLRRQG
ncbi:MULTISPECIES: AraC family transcriptional regulator [unclassified Roseitalea]|uniref:AraC family transcriptional regulator n=1 Tax=unclassified Roseitalea TaxID=2639107 RepID=UPI00273D7C9B|nr:MULTISPECIES: AraC family transcriptional regulator [unclassified Roseitalea]